MRNKRIVILNNLLAQVEEHIPFKKQINPSVSKSDIGWQLDHTLKVINDV
ncbi:hypothetical protein GCM10023314_24180 [Algibacter agarivorans]|uniref:DinB family protein n=1 Tax=Algibacter agarivorans TaxID=1109741 RepID=A0ABP9GQQ0_9FLAO